MIPAALGGALLTAKVQPTIGDADIPRGRGRDRRLPLGLVAVIGLSIVAYGPALRSFYHLDDIDILIGAASAEGPWQALRWLFIPHNEHLVPVAKAQFLLFHRLAGINAVPFLAFVLAQLVGVQILLWSLSARWFRTRTARYALVGSFGTTAVYLESMLWILAAGFVTSLFLSLLALFGVERYREGNKTSGALLAAMGSFLAPQGGLFGAPAGLWALAYAAFRRADGASAGWGERLRPGFFALLGSFAFLALYLVFARFVAGTGVLGDRRLFDIRLWEAFRLSVWATITRQWGSLFFFPLGPVLAAATLVLLAALRRHYDIRWAVAFFTWSFGNLFFVLVFRAWAGPQTALWGRYHLFSAAGTAALFALALDAAWSSAGSGSIPRWIRNKAPLAVGLSLLIANAAATATAVSSSTAATTTIRRFCSEWRRFPEAYASALGRDTFRIPDPVVRIHACPPRPLSSYSRFIWPRDSRWTVTWTRPEEGLAPQFWVFLKESGEFPTVRQVLTGDAGPP